jgi:hypothetical protein
MHYDTDLHDEFHDHFRRHHAHAASGYQAPATEIDELAKKIENEAEFLAQNSQTARAVVDFFRTFDREIRTATDNNVDLKVVLALGLIGVTVLEVGAAAATPVWVTLTLFTLNHVIAMHASHAEEARAMALIKIKS